MNRLKFFNLNINLPRMMTFEERVDKRKKELFEWLTILVGESSDVLAWVAHISKVLENKPIKPGCMEVSKRKIKYLFKGVV